MLCTNIHSSLWLHWIHMHHVSSASNSIWAGWPLYHNSYYDSRCSVSWLFCVAATGCCCDRTDCLNFPFWLWKLIFQTLDAFIPLFTRPSVFLPMCLERKMVGYHIVYMHDQIVCSRKLAEKTSVPVERTSERKPDCSKFAITRALFFCLFVCLF